MQFLYLAPVGLAQTTRSGDIGLSNPPSVNSLMRQLSRNQSWFNAELPGIASLLTALFLPVDGVARVGGEEFAVLPSATELDGAFAVADRLRQAVQAQAVEVDGVQIRYTISGGVVSMDNTVTGLDGLMKRADAALYAAKAGGRNRIECWSILTPDDT